jgi:RimJ/RimL family protein N-acetyltransferase/ribosomal protein S27E
MITEEEFIDFKCPHCGEAVSFPHADRGFVRACPSCVEDLVVPADGSVTGRKLPLPVTTPRLTLRRFGPGDWKDLMECIEIEEDAVLHWLEKESHVRLTTPEEVFHLGIELQGEDKLIGFFGLKFPDADRLQATVRISMNEKYAGKGFEAEAVEALLGFCFAGIKMHRVLAMCDSQAAADCQIFEQAGMRREGECVKDRLVDGKWINTAWYAALEEEFFGGNAEKLKS